jgi:hypothetical protein
VSEPESESEPVSEPVSEPESEFEYESDAHSTARHHMNYNVEVLYLFTFSYMVFAITRKTKQIPKNEVFTK